MQYNQLGNGYYYQQLIAALSRLRPLALDSWRKRTIFGNLSSFICRACPSHSNLSLIIALKSGNEPHFLYSLLCEIKSVSRVPRTIRRPFSGKHLANLHPFSEHPCFRAIFNHDHHCSFQYSNLDLQTYLPILPNFFQL